MRICHAARRSCCQHIGQTTPPACGLDQIQPETHWSKKNAAVLLLLLQACFPLLRGQIANLFLEKKPSGLRDLTTKHEGCRLGPSCSVENEPNTEAVLAGRGEEEVRWVKRVRGWEIGSIYPYSTQKMRKCPSDEHRS